MATLAEPIPTTASVSRTTARGPIVALGRLFFVLVFLVTGPGLFSSQTIAYAASQGVPLAAIAVPFAGVVAIVGAISILLGYHARIGAWLLVLFLVPVTLSLHKFWMVSDPTMHQMQFVNFVKNVSLLGGALLISQIGAGPWSLDERRK
jgi:putative oxidoreductase